MAAAAESVPVPPSIRQRVQESSKRIARVKQLDRLAAGTITVGGLFIIVAVLFIFLFIFGETIPLFRPAQGRPRGAVNMAAVPGHAGEKPLAIGTDEYQMYLYELLPDGRFVFFRLADGSLARQFLLSSLAGSTVVAASRSLTGDYVGAGTADGKVALAQVRFRPRYEEQKLADLEIEVRERGSFEMDPAQRPVRDVSYQEHEGRKAAAAVLGDDEIAVVRIDESEQEKRETLRTDGEKITHARLARTEGLVASTEKGNLHYWELGSEFRKAEVKHVSDEPITALEYALGANSLLVGGGKGGLAAWIRVRVRDEDENLSFVQAHTFEGQGTAIQAIGRSTRDKSFVTAGRDGSLVLRHVTSERTLLQFPALGQAVDTVLITPKSDGIIATRADGNLLRFDVGNPHPEVSWRALFGKVHYEGYARPEYVWQSTGATDDFHAKFSLIPLVFGTTPSPSWARSTPRSSCTRASRPRSSPWSRSWPRCRAWWWASSRGCGWRAESSATWCRCCS